MHAWIQEVAHVEGLWRSCVHDCALFVVQLLELCFEWVRVFLVHPDESLCQLQTQLSVRCHRDRHCGTCTYSRCFKTPLRARALTLSLRKILWVREMGVYVGWGIYSLFRNKCSQKTETHTYTQTQTRYGLWWKKCENMEVPSLPNSLVTWHLRPFYGHFFQDNLGKPAPKR